MTKHLRRLVANIKKLSSKSQQYVNLLVDGEIEKAQALYSTLTDIEKKEINERKK